jgi:hypothetical protein
MDADRRLALSNFYREEFLRHIEYMQASGILDDAHTGAVDRARRAVMAHLDDVCALEGFPTLAETLLRRFDALTRLSLLDPRQRH